MLKYKFPVVLTLFAWFFLGSSATSQIIITSTNQLGSVPFTPSWSAASHSLLSGLVPSVATGNFGEYTGATASNLTKPGMALTIEAYSSPQATNLAVCGNDGSSGSLLVYTLPAAANGYDLTNITVYGGWQDAGRDAQDYTVYYSTAANAGNFSRLTSVSYLPANPMAGGDATQVSINSATGSAMVRNVVALKFDFTTPDGGNRENGAAGYTGITVGGAPSSGPPITPYLTQDTVPGSATTVVGDQVEFTAAYSNSPPVRLQWLFNSGGTTSQISGATNATLVLNSVQLSNSGSYLLEAINATNSLGLAYSTPAPLVVISVPAATNGIIISSANQTGNGTGTFTPTWTIAGGSAIAGLQPSSLGSGNFNLYNAGGVPALTDGQFGQVYPGATGSYPAFAVCGPTAGTVLTYTLPAFDAYGFDISSSLTSIVVYGGWNDNGRDQQGYTVSYSTLSNPNVFIPLATVNYTPAIPSGLQSATRVTLAAANGAPLATNVAQVQFDFTTVNVENGNEGYAEVQLFGPPDNTPATVQRAFNLGTSNVVIVFSKGVTAASANNLANYGATNGLAITSASLASDRVTLTLTTAPLLYNRSYGMVINGVLSGAATPAMIASNTLVSFTAIPSASLDIGGSALASVAVVSSNGITVSAAGAGLGGGADQFNYQLTEVLTGDFDVSVCLAGLGLSDVWAEAGLMARSGLSPGAAFAASIATPGMAGCLFKDRPAPYGPAASSGTFPVNYPNTWLRLQRTGNTFTGFASYDGQTWSQLGAATMVMTGPVDLGFVTASHTPDQLTTAQFLNISNTAPNAVVGMPLNSHEPIGPSSRKTGLVISEIMWKPAARTDTNNCEFLELYNSQPFFHDLSGYQIVCADMNYTFPAGTIMPAGGYLVVAASPGSIKAVYGIANVLGPYAGSLKHAETLQLLDEQTNVLLVVPYTDVYPWPAASSGGTGHSLVLANPTYGEGDPRAWDISDVVGGSPGQMESFRPNPLRNVVINEILPHSENPAVPQFIELYNHGTNRVDISGCLLTDDPTTNKFVIPPGTVIGPAGFVAFTQTQFGFLLNGAGETLYLLKPDGTRVLDAVQFGAQGDGVSYGRWPDGANDFYAFTTNTPGTNNSAIMIGDIVINELMYDPISGNDDDQYIELYNQGTNLLNLAGWQFTTGVTFTFPNVNLGPNGYLVVARNLTNLLAKYPNLNGGNTVGNYSGKLSHNGEMLTLARPRMLFTNTAILVEEDEVSYGTGGRWGEWASGGGSSLELVDPHANHRLAANWADSDETQKSQWVTIQNTGVLDNGANYEAGILHAQLGLLDVGEALADNVVVLFNNTNCVMNSTFETGLGNWSLQGDHVRSSLENNGYQSGQSLHLRCSDRYWNGINSCQASLLANGMAAGNTVTLSFQARWLHGWPEAILRLNGGWLEATGRLPVPTNLGTPGAPNSSFLTNAGPAIYNVTHFPSIPAAKQPVVVSANVHDADGLQNLTLFYRLDPAASYAPVSMKDDGTGGDAVPGDGVFSATIPGQAANQIAAFYIAATDHRGATTRFPAIRARDNEPVRECVVMFGDSIPGGTFGTYHSWLTQTNLTRWSNLGALSNEGNDFTFVNGSRVIYNAQGRYSGSPSHQGVDTPTGNLCHYKWTFPDDDQFLGTKDFNKIHQPGDAPGDDPSLQREQTAYTFMRALGVPWLARRYVAVYVNGNRRGTLMEDTQVPGSDLIKEHFPNDADGYLYKMQPWCEFAPEPAGPTLAFNFYAWCNLMPYTTTGDVLKSARYRFNFENRRTPDSSNNFTNVFSLITAANSYGTPNYVGNLENIANLENWMRVFAANHAAGNRDCFGCQTAQNLYGYIGSLGTKYTLLMWDYNLVLGDVSGSWGPGQNLFQLNDQDPNMSNLYNTPEFLRMYWRALQELVNGPLAVSNTAPLCEAKFHAFVNAGLTVEDPNSALLPWIATAGSSIASQLAAVNASGFTVNPGVTVSHNVANVTGQAPVDVATVWINGVAYPLTWTTLTDWSVTLPLANGTNHLNVVGLDRKGRPITGDNGTVSVVYNGANPSPVGQIILNEIMYAPTVNHAQFVELFNNSTNRTFDLSGWHLPELGYTFPNGALLAPTNFLILAANGTAFAGAYGATNPVFDTFGAVLPASGTLTLITSSNVAVTKVAYESQLPWPPNADGTEASLQLIDPRQDNWRAGNWAAVLSTTPVTPDRINSVAASLTPFPSLWINEVQADNLTGITNRVGQRTGWLELYNPSTNLIALNGLYLANNYTNLLQWALPTNASLAAGQFKVVFVDAQTNLSTTNEWHTSFGLPSGSGSVALTRLAGNEQPQVLDYVDYRNLGVNDSYGSFPDGQSFIRQEFFQATPGAPNNGTAEPPPSFVDYATPASVYTQNFDSLPDPGTSSVNSANTVTIDGITYSLANPYDFAYPALASGSSGGLNIPTLAGWYGASGLETRFGATDGDQTTGGQISFGLPSSANRALGLLATTSTGGTAFGVRFLNDTGIILNRMNLQFTGEVWRQSNLAKTLQFYYFVDPTGNGPFPTNATASLLDLDVSFPMVPSDVGGAAVDGTSPQNQTNLSVLDQTITNWPPGAALWLVWQMIDATGKSQGLAIDNLSFSASVPVAVPLLAQVSGTNLLLNWSGAAGQTYQLEYKNKLSDPAWTPVAPPLTGTGGSMTLTNDSSAAPARFFHLRLLN